MAAASGPRGDERWARVGCADYVGGGSASAAAVAVPVLELDSAYDDDDDDEPFSHAMSARAVDAHVAFMSRADTQALSSSSSILRLPAAAAVDNDAPVPVGESFLEKLHQHESKAVIQARARAPAPAVAVTASDLMSSLRVLERYGCHGHGSEGTLVRAFISGARVEQFVGELRASVAGISSGNVAQARSDAVGSRDALLINADVEALASAPTTDPARKQFLAAATHVSDVLTRANFGEPALHAEIVAASAAASSAYELPLAAVSTIFINRIDRAWSAFVERIVDEDRSQMFSINTLATHTDAHFSEVAQRVLRAKRSETVVKARAVGLMACFVVQRSVSALRPFAGEKAYREDIHRRFDAIITAAPAVSQMAAAPLLGDSLLTETTLSGKVGKGLIIITNHAAKALSTQESADVVRHATTDFVSKFAQSWVRSNAGGKKARRKLAGLYVSAYMGVRLMSHMYHKMGDAVTDVVRDDHLRLEIDQTYSAFAPAVGGD
jgi:hypothetical protein